jgi:TolB protein
MKVATLILALALALAACAPADEDTSRLVIVDNGQVVVMESDGSARIPITEDPGALYFQPVWSPDAGQLAFSLRGSSPAILIASADGSATYTTPTETFPFYFSWSSGNDLAMLRNGAAGLTLDLTSLAAGAVTPPRQIESGQPLYFSWSPDGTTMVTHVGSERLELNDFSSSSALGPPPGSFQSPSWTDDGVVAIERGIRDQKLVIVRNGETKPLATVLGPTTLVATRDGSRVAIQSVFDDSNGLSVSYQTLPILPSNKVLIVDTADGSHVIASEGPALAYFWSANGERLLILDVVPGPQARWSVWSDGEVEEIIRFEPDPGFLRDLVPFFDQYAQSVSLWGPDASAFAFPGTIEGESGIWVQQLDGKLDLVSSGSWVSWSP